MDLNMAHVGGIFEDGISQDEQSIPAGELGPGRAEANPAVSSECEQVQSQKGRRLLFPGKPKTSVAGDTLGKNGVRKGAKGSEGPGHTRP